MDRVRPLVILLGTQVALGLILTTLALTGTLDDITESLAGDDREQQAGPARVNRFDEARAFAWLRRQVELGPRPAGSRTSRRLATMIRGALRNGAYQRVPGDLRNVVGRVEGRDPKRVVVVGAHYDTKDLPGFVGANDGAAGTAAVIELARSIRPRELGPTVVFILFDGEESPRGAPDDRFEQEGLRGSRVAARRYRGAEAMVLLDFVANRGLRLPREAQSDARLWGRLRTAAGRVGAGRAFPDSTQGAISDDHLPFIRAGVPSIDLIDGNFLNGPCWHRRCDDLRGVSARDLDLAGESVRELLRLL